MRIRLRLRRPKELDVPIAYAKWAPNYPARSHNAFMRAEEEAMLALLPEVREKSALDLASGTGRYSRILCVRSAKQVIALDLSAEMLHLADKSIAFFIQGDLRNAPLPASTFDLVICSLALGHIENLRHALAEISRLLKQGGVLLYSDFHPLGYLAGWRREFHGDDGRRYSLKHFPHLYSEHYDACSASAMRITAVREPIIGRDITGAFPGSKQVYRRWNGWPTMLVIRAEKN